MKDEFLSVCQVETPHYIVSGMWEIASKYRKKIRQVVDFGAGDGRFSSSKLYGSYLGYELDEGRLPCHELPNNAHIINADAFTSNDQACLCIGNPPYIRASGLDREWRESIARILEAQVDLRLMRNANLFIYFLFLALLRTKKDGLVVQLVPFEWVSRPSARPLRDYILKNGWNVNVYRFSDDIFDNVLTTVSITVIDKSTSEGCWRYYELSKDFQEAEILQPSGTNRKVISYSERHRYAYALRGLSPGGQDIFTLTEHQRLFYGLSVDEDVSRCITSLRHLPADVLNLTEAAFKKYYVNAGQKCWLIRSDREFLSKNLKLYLESIGQDVWGKYSTCTERSVWWKYRIHPAPRILVASGFRKFGPKIVKNTVKSIAVGAVYGVFTKNQEIGTKIESKLREKNFELQIVSHSNNLKKIEIRQLNTVLAAIINKHQLDNRSTHANNLSKKIQVG